MEIRVLNPVVNLQPLEESLLHVGRTKSQPVADVVKQQKVALRKQAAGEKGFERYIFNLLAVLRREDVEDISVQHK